MHKEQGLRRHLDAVLAHSGRENFYCALHVRTPPPALPSLTSPPWPQWPPPPPSAEHSPSWREKQQHQINSNSISAIVWPHNVTNKPEPWQHPPPT